MARSDEGLGVLSVYMPRHQRSTAELTHAGNICATPFHLPDPGSYSNLALQ